jgi:hypothetical protein
VKRRVDLPARGALVGVDYIFLVFYGARRHSAEDPEPLREVHLFISGRYLITVHRDPLPALDQQRHQLDGRVFHRWGEIKSPPANATLTGKLHGPSAE